MHIILDISEEFLFISYNNVCGIECKTYWHNYKPLYVGGKLTVVINPFSFNVYVIYEVSIFLNNLIILINKHRFSIFIF